MAYIQPNTTVHILRDVPLDEGYENTIYFGSGATQYNYMISKKKFSFDTIPATLTYQRVNLNTIRINKVADELYDCNYMMFQNTAYSNKWFYAFITNVTYINDNVSEVSYSIDVMQTWAFDYELLECFVEREHTATDVVGENLQDENLPTGEYVLGDDFLVPAQFKTFDVVMVMAYDINDVSTAFPASHGAFYRQLYSGCYYHRFYRSQYQSLTDMANAIQNDIDRTQTIWGDRSDGIIAIYMVPSFLQSGENTPQVQETIVDKQRKQSGAIFEGYEPRNKKLYTYPYNFLYVTNFQDVERTFPYEYFNYSEYTQGYNSNYVYFGIDGNITGQPSTITYPKFYKHGSSAFIEKNFDEVMTTHGYPQCAFNTDAFKAWLAQLAGAGLAIGIGAGAALLGGVALGALGASGATIAAGSINAGAATTALATSGGSLSTIGANGARVAEAFTRGWATSPAGYSGGTKYGFAPNGLGRQLGDKLSNAVANKMREGVNAFKNPIHSHGQQNGSALLACNALGFAYGNKHIRREQAEIIDQYFDMYGYACNRVKVPNRDVRTHWTYTKTLGCVVNGRLPKDDQKKIEAIFDNGIRFWNDGAKIGQYTAYAPTNLPVNV